MRQFSVRVVEPLTYMKAFFEGRRKLWVELVNNMHQKYRLSNAAAASPSATSFLLKIRESGFDPERLGGIFLVFCCRPE